MTDSCVVRMDHIWTHFGEVTVHRGISLCLNPGERLGLVGGSGSGKTTLLREMIGLLSPSAGHVEVLGRQLDTLAAGEAQSLRNCCGVLFQGGALFTDLSVFENVALPLREFGLRDETLIADLVRLKLRMVGLEGVPASLKPAALSGGMVRRVGLARALALEPELLFLDEPTAGLDPAASENFVRLLRALYRDLRFSMVMITHDLHTLRDLCDRIAVLDAGRLVVIGPLATVRETEHPFVNEFFHGPRARRVLGVEEKLDG